MARIAGRRGRVYIGIASAAAASPLPFQASWSINFSTERLDVTSFEDSNKTYVAGLPDATGQFAGFYDSATAQTYTAATDGVARSWYLYPDVNSAGTYWFGTILPDFQVESAVDDSIKVTASWSAASPISKVG